MADIKQILVTGGAGLLGANLCRRLLNDGHNVICLDNFFTSQSLNIDELRDNPHFTLIEHDVIEPIDLQVDEIYNLACPASPPHYQHNPIMTTRTSVDGAFNMLELALKNNAKILQASTSEVYGDPNITPQPESYRGNVNPIGPRACYDEGKRCAETIFFDYHRMKNANIRVMRIFNTYGPFMHPYDGRVVSNFILQALDNRDITLYGDGLQTRSFCYVDDLIEGMIRLMNAPDSTPNPVNIGNPNEFTIKQLAEQIIHITGAQSKMVYEPLPADDPLQRCPDISRAREHLNWEPQIQLHEGLIKTIEYFRNIDLSQFKLPTPNESHPHRVA